MSLEKILPTIPEIAAFQKAALASVVDSMGHISEYRVVGDGSEEDLSITNIKPSDSYKVIAHVDPGSSPVVALWVSITSYDGSGSYREWLTLLDGEWVGTETLEDYDGSSGVYSWVLA